ncbi:hypothetical protein AA313_de0210278 [Arthrobotrys entomopaga]|nr:hypothetical protein AA313_de0210278 [Arthrobotrys entomopaga]
MVSPMSVEIFELVSQDGPWEYRQHNNIAQYFDPINVHLNFKPTFLFAKSDLLQARDPMAATLRQNLQSYYGMPPQIWSNIQWESNGFFGCADGTDELHRVLSKMLNRHKEFIIGASTSSVFMRTPREMICVRQIHDGLDFYHGQMFSLKCRCEGMQQRHQNEIALTQSNAVASDAAAMKALGIFASIFLPATFVSGIFGMSFFDSGASGDPGVAPQGWNVSPKLWIYWAISIPLTALTLFLMWVL